MTVRSGVLAAAAVVAVGISGCTAAPIVEPPDPAGTRDVGIQLFQWTWDAIAAECEHLGDIGVAWVLTSPPQEHILGEEWWTAYQPVSYQVESRLGTRDQFASMVSECATHGVDIIADAVINHMTGQDEPGVGWAGSEYEHYDYPGLYTHEDFHHCTASPTGDIVNYRDRVQVQECELLNLADLATESAKVRDAITTYLEDLLGLGVAGFRIDAAKHIPAEDVAAIVGSLPAGTRIMHEVIRGRGEPITPEEYADSGEVFEFAFAREVKVMLDSKLLHTGERFGVEFGQLPSESAISFVDNHDTERNGETLSYKDGRTYLLANAFLLTQPYGTPVLYSGYAFTDADAGPPQASNGRVLDATCSGTPAGAALDAGEWVCTQRWEEIERLLAWRSAVGDAPVSTLIAERGVWAFERGELGYAVLNSSGTAFSTTVETSLTPGRYVDAWSGREVTVRPDGTVNAVVPAFAALAIDVSTWASTDGVGSAHLSPVE